MLAEAIGLAEYHKKNITLLAVIFVEAMCSRWSGRVSKKLYPPAAMFVEAMCGLWSGGVS